MPMERSVSCAERGAACYTRPAPGNDLRCYSASYAASYAPVMRVPTGGGSSSTKVQRAGSTGSSLWSRAAPAVQRSGSTRSVAGPTPGLNLRSYSSSYAASYRPFSDGAAAGQMKPAHSSSTAAAATWSSVGRRSVNLRGYTPSFAALVDDGAPVPAKTAAVNPDFDAELQRKKRLVAYKVYDVEGKVKISVRRGVKWIKGKYTRAVYGWW